MKLFVALALTLGLALAAFGSPFASSAPDGMEKVAADQGFSKAASDSELADAPLAGYGVRGVDNPRTATGLAGVVGTLLAFALGLGVFGLVRTIRSRSESV